MGRIKDRTPETAEIEPNSLIAIIVFKTPTLRKPINLMIANMAMSDLLCPIFLFPLNPVRDALGILVIHFKIGFFL